MPDQVACPHCDKTGFIRLEHVIKGGSARVAYYCGACEHDWSIIAPVIQAAPALPALENPALDILDGSRDADRATPDTLSRN